MSTAHRPTWAPAVGRKEAGVSQVISARDQRGQTKLKFRKPGQGTKDDIARRDLRLELAQAEKRAKAKKDGISEVEIESSTPVAAIENGSADEQAAKRRKLLEEAAELDKDDEDEDEDAHRSKRARSKSAQPTPAVDDEDDDDEDDDSEDETAELLRELEKIKRERAEEKERQERERLESESVDREASIATGNPLMNLEAALASRTPGGSSASGFAVKRRWDEDVIFNYVTLVSPTSNAPQESSSRRYARLCLVRLTRAVSEAPKGGFVNDLLRTEFHKRFLKRRVRLYVRTN